MLASHDRFDNLSVSKYRMHLEDSMDMLSALENKVNRLAYKNEDEKTGVILQLGKVLAHAEDARRLLNSVHHELSFVEEEADN